MSPMLMLLVACSQQLMPLLNSSSAAAAAPLNTVASTLMISSEFISVWTLLVAFLIFSKQALTLIMSFVYDM